MLAALGALAGCGGGGGSGQQANTEPVDRREEAAPGQVETLTARDPAGDVKEVGRDQPGISPESLDLREVRLRRDGDGLTVRFETAARPSAEMVQVLDVYDRARRRQGVIELRYRKDGSVAAFARPPGGGFERVEGRVSGSVAVARAPLNEVTREPRFKWRAYTASTAASREIRDHVPRRGDVSFFPAG